MALTRATKAKRLASLEAEIEKTTRAAVRHAQRAEEAEARAQRLIAERDWLKTAPVSDPLPEAEGGAE